MLANIRSISICFIASKYHRWLIQGMLMIFIPLVQANTLCPDGSTECKAFIVAANVALSTHQEECPDNYIQHKNKCVSPSQANNESIRKRIIESSIANYSGKCPCPYFTDRRGRMCGQRSAYSRAGGEAPLCYSKDVTDQMIQDYRKMLMEKID